MYKMLSNLKLHTVSFRTHAFAIRTLPDDMAENCTLIYNLNVRGKRGNIVQVYPGVEYDFVPNRLEMAVDDCIHIQCVKEISALLQAFTGF